MRVRILLPTLVGAMSAATAASAACNIDEAGLSERHAALSAERGQLTDEARQAFHSLRQSAESLSRSRFDAVCDEIVDAALRLLEGDAAWAAEGEASGDPDLIVGELNLVTFAATGRPVETATLVGRVVHSTGGGRLGQIEGVLLDQSRDASHLILSHGGFWEEGERMVAVPSARMLLDPSTGRLYSEIPPEMLAEAPEYDPAEPWRPAENDDWYDERAAEAIAAAEKRALEVRTAKRTAADQARVAAGSGEEAEAEAPAPAMLGSTADGGTEDGPKRIRIERDRPENAAGSSD